MQQPTRSGGWAKLSPRAAWGIAIGALLLAVVVGTGVQTGWWSTSTSDHALANGASANGPQVNAEQPNGAQVMPADALDWNDPNAWGGQVPTTGADVTIPAGRNVLLTSNTAPLGVLTINGSLTFGDSDVTLTARAVMVHGALQVGSTEQPFTRQATIVLTGTSADSDVMQMGTKVLGVMGGRLDLHGLTRPTWTRLGATAKAGSLTVELAQPMPWTAGDQIAIASTDFNPSHSETFTIAAIEGAKVTLDQPLHYSHWGTIHDLAGHKVDQRAEVALLTHNVKVVGEASTSTGGFGGHLMVMGNSQSRISGVEFTRMGQKGQVARYPIHFHLVGSAPEMSVTNTSIHHTFNRCITIHGTQDLTLTGNTCYDHIGHGVFFEDASETGVQLRENLSFMTRKPEEGQAVLASDADSPASFWITNPANTVENNVAAGSEGMGFWLATPTSVTGLSAKISTYASWKPNRLPLGSFTGNIAHSNDRDGFFVDSAREQKEEGSNGNFMPVGNPQAEKPEPVLAVFDGLSAYKNRNNGVWLRGSNQQVSGAILSDNGIGATFANDSTTLRDSLVVGETANVGTAQEWEERGVNGRALPLPWKADFPIRGFEFYDGDVAPIDSTFVNFTSNEVRHASALGFKLVNEFPASAANYASGVKLVDAQAFYAPNPEPGKDSDPVMLFTDSDGSLTGTAGAVVSPNHPFLSSRHGCTLNEQWNAMVCPPAAHMGFQVSTPGIKSAQLPVTLTSPTGATVTLNGTGDDTTQVSATVQEGQQYRVSFADQPTPQQTEFVASAQKGSTVDVVVSMASRPRVHLYECDISSTDPDDKWCHGDNPTSLVQLRAIQKPTAWWDERSGQLHLRLVTGGNSYSQLVVKQ